MDTDTQAQVQSDAPTPEVDTAPAPTSEADVQANDTPEAAVAQETTVNAEDTVEEKLYAGKYKTVEDMEKAYGELQSKFSTTTQQKAELSKILADAFAEPAPAPAATASYDDYDDDTRVAPQESATNRDIAVMKFVMSNPDADGAAILGVINSDPFIQQLPNYEAKLKYAHAISQSTAQPKVVEEAKKQAQVQTQAKIAEKQAAQVESASRQAPPTQEEPLTREQIRAALQSDDAFGALLKKRPGFKGYVG